MLTIVVLLGGCDYLTTPVDGAVDPRTPVKAAELHSELVPATKQTRKIPLTKFSKNCKKDRTFKHEIGPYKNANGDRVTKRCASDNQVEQICAISPCR